MIDYYKAMGCENGKITDDGLKILKMREDELSFPPRYQVVFNLINPPIAPIIFNVTIKFNDTMPLISTVVPLKRTGILT